MRESPRRSSPRVQISSREVFFPRARMLAHPTKTEKHKHKFCVETVAFSRSHVTVASCRDSALLLSRSHWKDCLTGVRDLLQRSCDDSGLPFYERKTVVTLLIFKSYFML